MAELSMGSASVTTNESESLLMIFPNPFTESTSIQIERSLIGETMFIYNQLGVLVRTLLIQNEQTTIYKEQLSPGFYYIRVGNYQGELILE
ncbi:MAG: T9SS type A sorting domain-containing protein [Crocinitomicaceae bacterium]|nr:T9SS type A sorting domain-containing protein [Crocinitomicaceae bacterium]